MRRKDKPGITPHVRKLLKEAQHLHKIKNSTGNHDDSIKFINKRREAKDALKAARLKYYSDLTSKIQNPDTTCKVYWKLVKSIYGPKQDSGIPTLLDNGRPVSRDMDKANLLNNYFASQTILPNSTNSLPDFEYLTDARLDRSH